MKLKYLQIVSLLFLVLAGCKDKVNTMENQSDNLNKYQEYVSEVTHGIISARSEVRLVMKQPVASWESGKELNDVLTVSPKVSGKVIVLDDRTISFVPEKAFKQNTEYAFTFDLEQVITDVPEDLEELTFVIKTLEQQFSIYTNPIQSYSKEKQYIEGQLRSADVLSLEVAKQLVNVTQNGKEIKIKFKK